MLWIFAFILVVHGLIHLMGAAKAFGLAQLSALTQPISRGMGGVWLLGALLCLTTVVTVFVAPAYVWMTGSAALLVSQWAILSAWRDARFGSLANGVLLLGVIYSVLTQGPHSFNAAYDQEVSRGLSRPLASGTLEESDLAALPAPVQQYVRATGFVGKPRVRNYQLTFRGRIRSAPSAPWMPFRVRQQSFVDEPTRLFLMSATLYGVPIQAWHRLRDGHARMHVKVLGALTMVDAEGPVMDRAETVTLFNDMCILAPGTLAEPAIRWEAVDAHTARARFTNGGHTISATLTFDDRGLLKNFISDDRAAASADGRTFTKLRFSTPVRDYRRYGPYLLASHGDARWHPPEGAFSYGEFDVLSIAYNIRP